MYDFKLFVENRDLIEAEEVRPEGIPDELWNNPNYRKFYTMAQTPSQHPQLAQQSTAKPEKAAKALGVGTMGLSQVENNIKSYLVGQGSMADSGMVGNLDKDTQSEIQNLIGNRSIFVHVNKSAAMREGQGVHFFKTPQGLAFVVVRQGVMPMTRPFGKRY